MSFPQDGCPKKPSQQSGIKPTFKNSIISSNSYYILINLPESLICSKCPIG